MSRYVVPKIQKDVYWLGMPAFKLSYLESGYARLFSVVSARLPLADKLL